MGTLGVVEGDPVADHPLGLKTIGQLVQIDRLVLERPPQAFDEDVVHAPAPAVHRDRHARVLQHIGEVEAGELAALVGVEDLRPTVSCQPFDNALCRTRTLLMSEGAKGPRSLPVRFSGTTSA